MSNPPIHRCPSCSEPIPLPAGVLHGSVQCPYCWIQSDFDFRHAPPMGSPATGSATPWWTEEDPAAAPVATPPAATAGQWWMDEDASGPSAAASSPGAIPVAGSSQAVGPDVWPTPADAMPAPVSDVVAAATATAELIALLAREDVGRPRKVEAVAQHVTAYGILTGTAHWLWAELSNADWSQTDELPLLLEVIRGLSTSALARLLAGAPADHLDGFFLRLIEFVRRDPGSVRLLTTVVAALDEERFCELLGRERFSVARYPPIEPVLGLRLVDLLRALPADPSRFKARWRLLIATSRLLPDGHERLRAWRQFYEALHRLVELCRQKPSMFSARRVASDQDLAARKLAAALENATPEDWYPAFQTPARRQEFLWQMLRLAAITDQDLPGDCEAKILGYFTTGRWDPAG